MANVVFSLNLDGSGFKTLHQFPTSFSLVPSGSITAELTLAGSTIVGTTNSGGSNGDGEIFSMNLGRLQLPCPACILRRRKRRQFCYGRRDARRVHARGNDDRRWN